jgi:hypothetical protein
LHIRKCLTVLCGLFRAGAPAYVPRGEPWPGLGRMFLRQGTLGVGVGGCPVVLLGDDGTLTALNGRGDKLWQDGVMQTMVSAAHCAARDFLHMNGRSSSLQLAIMECYLETPAGTLATWFCCPCFPSPLTNCLCITCWPYCVSFAALLPSWLGSRRW